MSVWTGTQSEIEELADECDAIVLSQSEVHGDGTPVLPGQRVTLRWDVPRYCDVCGSWSLAVMPGVESSLETMTAEAWEEAHSHGPTIAEQRDAVAGVIALGLTAEVAAAVSDDAAVAIYDDFKKAGIV